MKRGCLNCNYFVGVTVNIGGRDVVASYTCRKIEKQMESLNEAMMVPGWCELMKNVAEMRACNFATFDPSEEKKCKFREDRKCINRGMCVFTHMTPSDEGVWTISETEFNEELKKEFIDGFLTGIEPALDIFGLQVGDLKKRASELYDKKQWKKERIVSEEK